MTLALIALAVVAGASDAGLPDAGPGVDGGSRRLPDAGRPDPCAREADRLERRKAWLAARRGEQFLFGGAPDPGRGISNAIGIWCEAHPADEECALGGVTVSVDADELAWTEATTPEDLDLHVVLMRRALRTCRQQQESRGR